MTRARTEPFKTKTPLPGEGSGVINNSRRRETKTAPGSSFTTSTTAKLARLSAPGKRDGNAHEPLRR
jgi:hypothetical protein